jgi:tetratricopeptide (TPR) repeat protein
MSTNRLIFILFLLPALAAAQDLRGRADSLRAKGNARAAVYLYNKCKVEKPSDVGIYFARLECYYDLGEPDSLCMVLEGDKDKLFPKGSSVDEMSLLYDRHNLFCDTNYWQHFALKGKMFMVSGRFEEAIKTLNRGIAKFPLNALLFSVRGEVEYNQKSWKDAMNDLQHSLKNPDTLKILARAIFPEHLFNPEVMNKMCSNYVVWIFAIHASSCSKEQNFKAGRKSLKMVNSTIIKEKGYYGEIIYNEIGSMFCEENNNYKDGLVYFKKALAIDSNYVTALINKAMCLINLGGEVIVRTYNTTLSYNGPTQQNTPQVGAPLPISKTVTNPGKKMHLMNAIDILDRVAVLDKKNGFAYALRGYAKHMAGHADYCYDFNLSKLYGHPGAQDLLNQYCK